MFFYLTGVNINVTIITDPDGVPVTGFNNTFDYPILTSVNLLCMATTSDGLPVTVTSYTWTTTDCYNHTDGVLDPCFYSDDQTTGNFTISNLLAQDAGTVTCSITVDGVNFTSDPLTLRISGEHSCRVRQLDHFSFIW